MKRSTGSGDSPVSGGVRAARRPAAAAAPYTLYGSRGSGSAAVEMALERAGLAYRVVRASTWEADSARDELAAVNPLGQIPTLRGPDGSVMTESAAILIHLGLSCPDSRLLPADASQRAQVLRGLVFIAANAYPAVGISDYPERWTLATEAAAHEAVRSGARRQLHRHWETFADIFAARPYLGGRTPGALDFLAVVVSKWSGARAHLRQARPGFTETLARIERHAAVAPVVARHWPPKA